MSDSERAVDIETLRTRLSADWTVETVCGSDEAGSCADGDGVRGYADNDDSGPQEKANGHNAAFEIRRDGELWMATWLDRRGPSADHTADHRVTGIRERCVEWVVERARCVEEANNE